MALRKETIGVLTGIMTALLSAPGRADFDSGSDGSDLAFNPVTSTVIDLSLASTASWDTPSPNAGLGVYDPDQWAVVFKYTTINIPAGVTVTFLNHPSGAPVVWLSQGQVNIAGTVDVSGKNGSASEFFASPGPGGFSGGSSGTGTLLTQSPGFGPGGGLLYGGLLSDGLGGSHATLGLICRPDHCMAA